MKEKQQGELGSTGGASVRRGSSPRGPGDRYVIAAAVVGALLGAAVGFFISAGIGGLLITILCSSGGALIGGTVGAWLGEKLEARLARRSKTTIRDDSDG